MEKWKTIESIARSVNLSISTLPEDYYARVSKGYLVGIQSCFEKYLLAFKELRGNPTENIEKYMDDVFKCAILSSARKRRELPDAKL